MIFPAATVMLGGCVLAPREAGREADRADAAGRALQYDRAFEQRTLPDLPPEPAWQDVLHRAFLANGELEAAYHEWVMANARVPQEGAWPNSPLMLEFEYMFSAERMKSWDRTTVVASPDPMQGLSFPTKTYQSAKVAMRDAQATGERFAAAKFDLQRRVLNAWVGYALQAEKVRIQRENVALLRLLADTARGRVQAGASQQDLLRADIELRLGEDELRNLEADVPSQRAALNAMLGRDPQAPLPEPARLPDARPVPDDAALLAVGVAGSPELAALAREVSGREDALERARQEYIPDINPFAGFTGSISQVIGAGVTFPTVIPRIRGMIREARADLRRVQAMARQTRLDRAADYVAALYALRNSERQAALLEDQVLPAAERVLDSTRQAYTAGTGMYLDLIESQRTLLDVRLALAEARASREQNLVDLEALAGVDVETLAVAAAARPSTRGSTRPATAAGAEVTR
jgi:outer membrane protein TolC